MFSDNFDSLRWLDDIACAELGWEAFFVPAGHAISEDVLQICRGCPVRKECVTHAYTRELDSGYFGGLSPSYRREVSLVDALVAIEKDPVTEVEKIKPIITTNPKIEKRKHKYIL